MRLLSDCLVPQARLERARRCRHQILSLARLPIPPLGQQDFGKERHNSGAKAGVNAGLRRTGKRGR